MQNIHFIDLEVSLTILTHTRLNNIQKINILNSRLWYKGNVLPALVFIISLWPKEAKDSLLHYPSCMNNVLLVQKMQALGLIDWNIRTSIKNLSGSWG